MWITTKNDLRNVILREKVLSLIKPTQDRNIVHSTIGNLFSRYIILVNNLSAIYDQTLQVQKRPVIEKLLMSSTKRLLELQKEMQKIEMSNFTYIDDALVELKWTTQNIEFLRPFYFPRKRNIEIQQVVDEIPIEEEIFEELKGPSKFRKILTQEEIASERRKKTLRDATNLIITHEKARQDRIRFLNLKLFPETYKILPREPESFPYTFTHKPDQIPLHKIKRTKYHINFYLPKIDYTKFKFYEPPIYRINRLGQKVIDTRKSSAFNLESHEEHREDSEEISNANMIEKYAQMKAEEESKLLRSQYNAASIIQRAFRRYQRNKILKKQEYDRLALCNLVEIPVDPDKPDWKVIQEELRKKRRDRKKEFDEKFIKALEDEKARILKLKSHLIMEDITEDIRQWFREFYDGAQDFHTYPEEFEEGTIMVMRGETKTVEEFIIEKNKTPAEKAKERADKKKQKKEEKNFKKKQADNEKKLEEIKKKLEIKQGPTWDFSEKKKQSKNFEDLQESFNVYEHEWKFINEIKNRHEVPIWDWVTIDAYADVHKELRLIVDDFMRIELELLRVALAIDNETKYVPPKRKKEKNKKKNKKKCLLTLLKGEALKIIIRKYTKRSLDDFIGDENYAAYELRKANKNPLPHYGDYKNILRTMVIGMGPLEQPRSKSICIVGPPKCGKKLITEALCTEMDAVIFDLSASNITSIDDVPAFLTFVMQMAQKLQPSVIFIDGAHKPFITKIPPEEVKEDPKKLGKFLKKYVYMNIKSEDAVMMIGTTNQPWNCSYAAMKQCFEKFITFPPQLDYGTALMAWNKGLRSKKVYNLDVSPLAKVTQDFTVGDILDFIEHFLNLTRRMNLKVKPLTSKELLDEFLQSKIPLDDKMKENFMKFMRKTDPYTSELQRTMQREQAIIDKEKENEAKKAELAKKKKSKGGRK
ncbi:CLUMA_CG015424, isoform A [Clunio marinus]|uniref:CLUMA_CG015424, isoform A n=1 Tax=Clunio marinus TaxID=568069 RepID=A0A1J1IUN9_9DIPT|nr:CLUMA_CG015424, isoform A [Clunio marinus]